MDGRRFHHLHREHSLQKQNPQNLAQNLGYSRPFTITLEVENQPEQARGVQVTYTNDPDEAEAWLQNNVIDSETKALGFDMEWKPQFVKKKLGGKENKTATLQLSTETAALVLHLFHLKKHPKHFVEILANPNILKVGCGIRRDVTKLFRDSRLQCKGAMDLGELSLVSGYTKQHGQGLCQLARNVLEIELKKPKSVTCSNWEKLPLTSDQIRYGALDAWVGIKLYSHMEKKKRSKLQVKLGGEHSHWKKYGMFVSSKEHQEKSVSRAGHCSQSTPQ